MTGTGFYITAKRGDRVAWLSGPFVDHGAALMLVEAVRRLACAIDPWCDFDAFGTASITSDRPLPAGKLNDQWSHYPA